MEHPLKLKSVAEIEAAIAKALSELTGHEVAVELPTTEAPKVGYASKWEAAFTMKVQGWPKPSEDDAPF